jgi:type I restriction enzyme S subunit
MSKHIKAKIIEGVDFPIGWEMKELVSLGKVSSGGTPDTTIEKFWNGNINWCTPTDITKLNGSKYIGETVVKISDEGLKNSSATLLPKGSVIVCTRATIGKAAISVEKISTNQGFKNIIPNEKKVDVEFLYYSIINSEHQLLRLGNGSTFLEVSKSDFQKFRIPLPPLAEQKAIASILSTWDDTITKTQKLIAQLQLRNKWLTYQLLTGKRRVKKFIKSDKRLKTRLGELPVDWKLNFIKNILSPVKNSLIPNQDESYQQIGIRSHTKGIFYKEKITGKALGTKRVFWIEPHCFIVNIVFAWEHAIAKTTETEIGMIASHRFPMYKPKIGVLDLDYLLCYFKSIRGKHQLGLASPGGAGRNKTLGQSEFVKLQIPVPSFQEQIAIADLINSAEREMELMNTKLKLLKDQKKGLMQILLTGKKQIEIK